MLILAWTLVLGFGTQFSAIKQNNINILLSQQSHVGRAFSIVTQSQKHCKNPIYVRIKTKRTNHFSAVKNAGRMGRGRVVASDNASEKGRGGKPIGK
ncbi:MAG: hypothetical protein K2N56_05215, partial [Oscillospiraceae bacterium]|nr:hypothetical protein [Oscillospiraceae bacterium]